MVNSSTNTTNLGNIPGTNIPVADLMAYKAKLAIQRSNANNNQQLSTPFQQPQLQNPITQNSQNTVSQNDGYIPGTNIPVSSLIAYRDKLNAARQAEMSNLPTQKFDFANKINSLEDIINAYGSGFGQSVVDSGKAIANILGKAVGAQPQTPSFVQNMNNSIRNYVSNNPQIAQGLQTVLTGIQQHPIVQKVGEYLNPYTLSLPEAKLGDLVGLGSEGSSLASKLTNKLISGGATGAYTGALLNPNNMVNAAGSGAIAGGALSSMLGAPAAMVDSLTGKIASLANRPGSELNSPQTVANLIANINPEKNGLQPSLGDVTNYPQLSRFYSDVLGNAPFSGVRESDQKMLDYAKSFKNNIISSLDSGIQPDQREDYILSNLQNLHSDLKDIENNKYNEIYDQAANNGIMVNTKNFQQKAADLLPKYTDIFNRSLITNDVRDILKSVSQSQNKSATANKITIGGSVVPQNVSSSILNKINDINTPGVNETEISKTPDSARQINFSLAKLMKLHNRDQNDNIYVLNQLKNSLKSDLSDALNNAPQNTDLQNKLFQADQFHRDFVAPFTDPANKPIADLINGDAGSSGIATKLLNNNNKQFFNLLDPDTQRTIVLQSLMRNQEDPAQLSMKVLLNRFNKNLTPSTRKTLYSNTPGLENSVNQLGSLSKITSEAALHENMPATGFRNLSTLQNALKLIPSAFVGSMIHGIPGAIEGSVGTTALGRGLASALRSNWLRNAYINQQTPKFLNIGSRYPGILGGIIGSSLS